MVKGKASQTVLKAATGKNDGWKQERHSHIASKMKSMLMDDGKRSDMLGNRRINRWTRDQQH